MRALFLSILLASAQAQAANQPTPFDTAAWQKLLDKASVSTVSSEDANGSEYRSLQAFSNPDPTVTRTAEYFSVVGHTQTDGIFGRMHVEIVSESWVVDAKQIRTADQWAYALALDGHVTFAMHQQFSEDPDGLVLSDVELPVPDLADPALLKQVGAKLQEWEAR